MLVWLAVVLTFIGQDTAVYLLVALAVMTVTSEALRSLK
jgi:hypothetical protein